MQFTPRKKTFRTSRSQKLRLEALEDRRLLTTFGEVTNLSNVNTPDLEWQPDISSDGLALYFRSDRDGGFGRGDLYQTTRPTTSDPFGTVMNLGSGINTEFMEATPSISSDGHTIYFHSDRDGGEGGRDLYQATRSSLADPFDNVVNLRSINTGGIDAHPSISADGLTIYFQSDRPGGEGGTDLYHATRATLDEPFGSVTNLGPSINTSADEGQVHIAADSFTLLFNSTRDGGYGSSDLYKATRSDTASAFGTAVNLGPMINTTSGEWGASLSHDGDTLFFHSDRAGGTGLYDLYQAVEVSTMTSTYVAADVPMSLKDARGRRSGIVTSTIAVADSAIIVDANVQLDISHSRDEDLDVFLISPSGTIVQLFSDVGGNGNNFTGTILDDEAATPIGAGAAPFSGAYQPEGSLANLDLQNAQGTWTLEIRDDAKNETGTLNSWELDIATIPAANTQPVAEDDSAITDKDAAVTVQVLDNDTDADGDTLTIDTVGITTPPQNGSASSNGDSVTYTPNPGWTGTDSFSYTVSDGNGGTDTGIVSITVSEPGAYTPIYVYDIRFESKRRSKDWRAVFEIRSDSNDSGGGDAGDSPLPGVEITVLFAGNEYTGTTDADGSFRTDWIRKVGAGSYEAKVTDLALASYSWEMDWDMGDGDEDGDGVPDNILNID